MRAATVDAWRRGSLWATLLTWPVLVYLVWFVAPDWSGLADVSAPLTRKVLFFHPASAWAAFAAYFVVFALSIAVLNERDARYDAPARAAAEVGFWFNTVALATGTLWGIQEWSESGNTSLATVYSEPKVLVVVVLWFTFAAYLLLRRLVDGEERRARLSAAFGVLGFLGVPLSFATSRLLSTSLHPDIAGPGSNPDAAVGPVVGAVLAFSAVAFLALFLHLWLARLRLARLSERLEALETQA
ncbi:MAG TPA: cytochrome c biogenesis protein CcsA [Candidatus Thermoplasmatota archaeon]|nr:cytochrome c biogenesis protein CcsA [Candidatus Thermoplasmatota archaeon]